MIDPHHTLAMRLSHALEQHHYPDLTEIHAARDALRESLACEPERITPEALLRRRERALAAFDAAVERALRVHYRDADPSQTPEQREWLAQQFENLPPND